MPRFQRPASLRRLTDQHRRVGDWPMTRTAKWPFVLVTLSFSFGCGGRRIDGSSTGGAEGGSAEPSDTTGASGPGATDAGPSSADDGPGTVGNTGDDTPVPPLECPEGRTACPNSPECVNLLGDVGNCGECGHNCEGTGTSARCSEGQCEPGLWPCIPRAQGSTTCSEACASIGETCAVEAYCSDFVDVYLTDGPNDSDPRGNLESCLLGFGGESFFQIGCDDPIDWDYEIGGRIVVAARCCCTQD